MPIIRFIDSASGVEKDQIVSLYRAEGWWYPDESSDQDAFRLSGIINGSHCFAVADMNGRIIGMGRAISDRFSDAYIQDVAVSRDCRGKGVGTAIVSAVAERLEADGLGWIGLIAERHSEAFYTRLGFSPMADATPLVKTSS
ncbi:MAG: GNAT family N-acetyltransferase [Pseudomonadota bacterium]